MRDTALINYSRLKTIDRGQADTRFCRGAYIKARTQSKNPGDGEARAPEREAEGESAPGVVHAPRGVGQIVTFFAYRPSTRFPACRIAPRSQAQEISPTRLTPIDHQMKTRASLLVPQHPQCAHEHTQHASPRALALPSPPGPRSITATHAKHTERRMRGWPLAALLLVYTRDRGSHPRRL